VKQMIVRPFFLVIVPSRLEKISGGAATGAGYTVASQIAKFIIPATRSVAKTRNCRSTGAVKA